MSQKKQNGGLFGKKGKRNSKRKSYKHKKSSSISSKKRFSVFGWKVDRSLEYETKINRLQNQNKILSNSLLLSDRKMTTLTQFNEALRHKNKELHDTVSSMHGDLEKIKDELIDFRKDKKERDRKEREMEEEKQKTFFTSFTSMFWGSSKKPEKETKVPQKKKAEVKKVKKKKDVHVRFQKKSELVIVDEESKPKKKEVKKIEAVDENAKVEFVPARKDIRDLYLKTL